MTETAEENRIRDSHYPGNNHGGNESVLPKAR
jgi:hypothetical protein